jgi:hypothetical protein
VSTTWVCTIIVGMIFICYSTIVMLVGYGSGMSACELQQFAALHGRQHVRLCYFFGKYCVKLLFLFLNVYRLFGC